MPWRYAALKSLLSYFISFLFCFVAVAHAQEQPKIEITEPVVAEAQEAIKIAFKVRGASKRRIRVKVDCGADAVTSKQIDFSNDGEHVIAVNLFKGKNTITLIGFVNDEPVDTLTAPIVVKCSGRWCKEPFSQTADAIAAEAKELSSSTSSTAATSPTPATSPATIPASGQKPAAASSQKGSVHITSPATDVRYVDATTIPVNIKVDPKADPSKNVKSVSITVLNEKKPIVQNNIPKEIKFSTEDPKKAAELTADVKIGKGRNVIQVFDEAKPDDEADSITVICEGKCATEKKETAETSKIKVEKPQKGSAEATVVDVGTVDSYLTIASDSTIKDIQYSVFNGATTVHTSEKFPVPTGDAGKPISMRIPVAILKGTNTIRFFDAVNSGSKDAEAFTEIVCNGERCPQNYLTAKFPSSSQNSRIIVGFEQAGGSSAASETKPFVDLFFLTPFWFDREKDCEKKVDFAKQKCEAENARRRLLPRFGFWGDVRLAATPDQIAAVQVFPANLVNQVDRPKAIDLVQSFDFLAGGEFRIKTGTGSFLSLIPGVHQISSLYFAAGGGAISPLTARRESVQIFNIPPVGDPRREDFLTRYGPIPDQPVQDPPLPGKEFVAIVPIDRDRFLRQWYAGLRLKTYYCETSSCSALRNSFPAVVDVMLGQNEAVTGGSRNRGGTPDPNNPEKLIGERNSFVLRIDGFYPFPIKEANFIYFYGTALMKVFGGGVKITTPLFLDNPGTTVDLSDPRVYIPPTNILKLQQPDRDYYKIGVGINLTELFNRNKPR